MKRLTKPMMAGSFALLMLLAPLAVWSQQRTASTDTRYTCPMHPHYIATDPDGVCPICGMDLVPVREGAPAANNADSSIVVPAEMLQSMGVRTAPAAFQRIERTLRAFGVVEANERLESVAVSRFEGWIADLTVRAEGDAVQPGALLFSVYSPELIAAQKELLAAVATSNPDRQAAVRQRLRSLGMQAPVIDEVLARGEVIEEVPVYAEAGGTVVALEIRAGDYIEPGTPILRLQSYAEVWVMASIPETDLPLVDTGLPVRLHFPSAPAASEQGVIDYVYPTIDPKTRTARVRIVVDNRAGALRPGAYADVAIDLASSSRLAVPTEAILRDSRGAHVVLARGEGRFDVRAVRLGDSGDGFTEVLEGLQAGEQVVVSGQFLLDSEVNLREGFAKLAPAANELSSNSPLATLPIDNRALAELDHAVDMALYFHEALVDRYAIDPYFVQPAVGALEALVSRYDNTRLAPLLKKALAALGAAREVREGAALAAELARLVDALTPWLLEGRPAHYRDQGLSLYEIETAGQRWLQQGGDPLSPYGEGEVVRVDWPGDAHGGHSAPMNPSAADGDAA
ncbi:MAG: efflux RND transporter periplasmic adaptor subunit [Halieaceae bacterium]|jgi:Cu(I)/Ag(I) efflux system membrane fusion protein|nr:efflux RND transporter periplasmic adaptor subunit [Halieaceae bacterium]